MMRHTSREPHERVSLRAAGTAASGNGKLKLGR